MGSTRNSDMGSTRNSDMGSTRNAHTPAIAEYYAGKSVFVTGATGFMGKVLVEKILRSCPDIKCIYLLIRSKKGKDAQKRLNELLESNLFDTLREHSPDFKSKMVAVEGDIVLDGLGLDQIHMDMLAQEIHVVFHLAATIKFDEEMKIAVKMNLLGVKGIIDLCHKLPKLECFVHVSTAYAHCDRDVINEELYPPPVQPKHLFSACEWMDAEWLNTLTPKMIGDRPNTYTYTKAVAEALVGEMGRNLPVAIIRPSIVAATLAEPVPGWSDNVNGTTGLLVGVGKGVLRTCHADGNAIADIIPVDMAANIMISAGWYTATQKPKTMQIYHCTTGEINGLTWNEIARFSNKFTVKHPMENIARVPYVHVTNNTLWHSFQQAINQWLPAYIVDFYMLVSGQRRMFVRIQGKVQKLLAVLEFFGSKSWAFTAKNIFILENAMTIADRKVFPINGKYINWADYTENYCLGCKQYIMKEDMARLPDTRKAVQRLQRIWFIFNTIVVVAAWRFLVTRVKVTRFLWNMLYDSIMKLLRKLKPKL